MNYKINKASMDNIKEANRLLTKLIRDEKQYDNNINENCVVNSFYENVVQNDDCVIFYAELDNKVVGYLYGFVQNNGDTYKEIITQLDAMFIEEAYRKQGIGSALINEFKSWSKDKGAKYIELKVYNNNIDAISLYKKNDFNSVKSTMKCDI